MNTQVNALLPILSAVVIGSFATADIPRTEEGKPDMSGTYNVGTSTSMQRNRIFGDNRYMTEEQAERYTRATQSILQGRTESDPNREAPPDGGDGSPGAAGNVGGYNAFWIPRDGTTSVGKMIPTSIIYEPENGRYPPRTEKSQKRRASRYRNYRQNDGTAWWLENEGPGPYDDPELRPLAERCLLGFSSTSGPPMLPALYNNTKRIVQTPDTVMILIEMNHDARIVRMNGEHVVPDVRKWMGDSIGHWEGDTLVVDTTNFADRPGLGGATRNLHVVERFSRVDESTLLYDFTVDDPTVWTQPWQGQYSWPETEERLYEYACHEGNYALGNILRGARILEADAMTAQGGE